MNTELTIPLQRAVLVPLRVRNEAEAQATHALVERLKAAAAADQHIVVAPTHVMLAGEEIMGYLSIGGLPTVQAWFNSAHKNPAHSIRMIEHAETIGRERGMPHYCVAVAAESPFSPHMARMGYDLLGTTNLWIKAL